MAEKASVRLWDAPVRLVHWGVVLLMPALWWTGENGEIGLHKAFGYVMLGLVLFRILWGFFGSATARFGSFVRGPMAVIAYVRALFTKGHDPVMGHNPLGGWSVVLLLTLLFAQAVIGLFAQDVDAIESGPLTHLISYEMADSARELHHLIFNGLTVLVAIHIAAILFYLLVKRDNLIVPMITGRRAFAHPVAQPILASFWRSLVLACLVVGLVVWISFGAPI